MAKRQISDERLAAVKEMLDDGASHFEIQKTLKVHHETIQRHFPGTQWTKEQRAKHGVLVKRLQALK